MVAQCQIFGGGCFGVKWFLGYWEADWPNAEEFAGKKGQAAKADTIVAC